MPKSVAYKLGEKVAGLRELTSKIPNVGKAIGRNMAKGRNIRRNTYFTAETPKPTTQLMTLGDSIAPFYDNHPGGLRGATDLAYKAWLNTNPTDRLPRPDSMDALNRPVSVSRHVPITKMPTAYGLYDFIQDRIDLANGVSSYKPTIRAHELTHAMHMRGYSSIAKQPKSQRGFRSQQYLDKMNSPGPELLDNGSDHLKYLNDPTETAARLAEAKRYYIQAHPGATVSNPEEAKTALDWFLKTDTRKKKYNIDADTQSDLRQLQEGLVDPKRLHRMMPTLVRRGQVPAGRV